MSEYADFEILMLGARRAGKSSVLSAMLKSIEQVRSQTGFSFSADPDTKEIMRSRLSDLEKLYVMHAGDPDTPFSTLIGTEGGEDYSPITADAISYFFQFSIAEKKKKATYTVEFIDIPGEQMVNTGSEKGITVIDRFMKSHMVIVAVDAPALMEGREKAGVGEFHRLVNIPDSVYDVVSVADCRMREKLKKKEVMTPKMILFVPLKCEKYYHEHTMDELNRRVKLGYQRVFSFLEQCPEYTVAITPILTLGDIVFDHYGTKLSDKGVERVAMLNGSGVGGLKNMPERPMYKIRSPECTTIKPKYCEQPLLYLAGYIMGMQNYLIKAEKKVEEDAEKHTVLGKIWNMARHAVLFYLFGVFYIVFLGLSKVLQDRIFMDIINRFSQNIKTSGDGYEIVQDNLEIQKLVKSCAESKERWKKGK